MEGQKTVLSACVTGSLPSQDGKEPEAYKINVVFSDGSKVVLRKTYEEFVGLQGVVYELLKKKAGYSRKTSRSLVSPLPDLNSTLSRILSKDTDLKKMSKVDEFMKELFTLPQEVTESETFLTFFGAFLDVSGNYERFEEEEELKRINKESHVLSGSDSLRPLPTFSPLPKRKTSNQENSSQIRENVNDETRQEIFMKLKEKSPTKQVPQIPGRRITSCTDEDLGNRSPRPGLIRRPFTVAANLSDMKGENKDMNAKFTERPYSPATTPVSSPRPGLKKRPFSTGLSIADKLDEMNVAEVGSKQSPRASPRSPRELSLSRSQENVTPPPENPRDSDSVVSVRKESRARKISSQTGRLSPPKIKYAAVSSFHGEEKGEVVLEEGEEVEVLQKEASGWWYVKTEVSEGWAPCAFLVPVQSSRSSSPVPASQEQSSERQEENSSEGQKEEGTVKTQSMTRNAGRKISTEMNRRVKFLTVEGIQKRKNPDKNYVYILKVVWSDGTINIVYRQCSDFFYLQENLRKEFPSAIGKEIPVLKGKKFTENCRFCFKDGTCKRRQFMNQFCHELITAPDHISKSAAVMTFCRPRASDLLPHGQNDNNDNKSSENNDDNVQISGPVVFEQYIVVADYKKKNKNDISLTAGETVDVVERNDYGWWLVDREGELGWAPASHLEPVDDGSEITTSKTFPPGQEEIYQSIESYEARAEDELSFDVGVMLKVVEKTLDGWWLVRFQGDEGWAPAMHMKKVADSSDSSLSSSGQLNDLDIVAFNGDSEGGDGKEMKRTPPTRRSMVQKSIRRKPKVSTSTVPTEEAIKEEAEPSETTNKKNTRSISVPSRPTNSPRVSPRASPRPKLKSRSSDMVPGDASHQLLNREVSISSGYGSSPTGSLTSLTSEVFTAPEESPAPIKKCATLPRFQDVTEESGIPRSHSVTSFAQYKKENELAVNGNVSLGLRSPSGRWSPVPAPRKTSTSRRSPLAGSPATIQEMKMASQQSSLEIENENAFDFNNSAETPRRISRSPSPNEKAELVFRALYPYISQEDGEITFNVGDVVEVIQRGQNGWWLLKSDKAGMGWGPSNYLESVVN